MRLTVADTGIGIPLDEQERVFDRFYQVDGSERRAYRGTGLGLSICRHIVERHNGRIWVESDGCRPRQPFPCRAADDAAPGRSADRSTSQRRAAMHVMRMIRLRRARLSARSRSTWMNCGSTTRASAGPRRRMRPPVRVPQGIPRLLDLFDRYGIRATFLSAAATCRRRRRAVAEMVRRGHEVANHSARHRNGFARLSPPAARRYRRSGHSGSQRPRVSRR